MTGMNMPSAEQSESLARNGDDVARYTINFREYLEGLLAVRASNWLAKRNRRNYDVQVCCFPRDFIGRHVVANGYYEELILRLLFEQLFKSRLSSFKGATVLDVGANIGNHSCWFSGLFARVIAFEPNPLSAHLLEANRIMNRLDNVELVQVALSDRNGQVAFEVNCSGNLGGSKLSTADVASSADAIEVAACRGDVVLESMLGANEDVALLKVDVEGHEHAALRGLERTIRRHKPIIMFESASAHGEGGSHAVLDMLEGWGYENIYVVEPAQHRSSWLMRALSRVISGYSMRVSRVRRPDDRFYSLIVVSTDPLAE